MTDRHGHDATQDSQEIVLRLLAAEAELRAHFEAGAADVGLSPTQAQAVLQLELPQRMGQVASQLRCEPSHLTAVADTLERSGLLQREPDPLDRRAKRLVLTPQGELLRQRLVRRLFDGAPIISVLDAAQRAELLALLRAAQPTTS